MKLQKKKKKLSKKNFYGLKPARINFKEMLLKPADIMAFTEKHIISGGINLKNPDLD